MGCACRKKKNAKSASQTAKKAPRVKVGRAIPSGTVTKRLPRGTRVRR